MRIYLPGQALSVQIRSPQRGPDRAPAPPRRPTAPKRARQGKDATAFDADRAALPLTCTGRQ